MRMRQSIAQFEAAFLEETVEDRARREHLRKQAVKRSRLRRRERATRNSSLRFVALILAMTATTVLVTVAMFRALALMFA
jgi:hypothetical protein